MVGEKRARQPLFLGEQVDAATARAVLKHSLNADTEHIAGLARVCFDTLTLFGRTDEAREGYLAFAEKRPADFTPFQEGDDR